MTKVERKVFDVAVRVAKREKWFIGGFLNDLANELDYLRERRLAARKRRKENPR